MNKSSSVFSGLVIICLLLLMGCGAGNSAETKPTEQNNTAQSDLPPVRVAVLAIRSAEAANKQYGAIINHLSETLDRPFELVPVGQEQQFEIVANGNVDFTYNNPLAAVQLHRLYDTQYLATLERANTGTEFSGLIIARRNSGITEVADLVGKNVTCVAFQTAAAGCNFQVYHVLQNGVSPDDFASFTETGSQDNIVLGVLNETFDAGFIRTGQLEKMVREGTLLNQDEIVIVDQADDDFHFPHTTRLYPEWPMAALEGTDPALSAAVRDALLAIPADSDAMINASASGFVPAVDYTPLDDLIELLELRSFDAVNK